MSVRTNWAADKTVSIWVDDQHISRMSRAEVRELMCQLIVFAPKKLREEMRVWISDDAVGTVADALSQKDVQEQP